MKNTTVASVLSACLFLFSPDVRGTSQQLRQEMSLQAVKRLIHFHTEEGETKTTHVIHTHKDEERKWMTKTVQEMMQKVPP